MEKIIGVYKITNTITGDFYVGSSKNIKNRWVTHKCQSTWKKCPNNPMYLDMKKYGTDKFEFEILEEVESESLKEAEQQFIKKMHPTYNNINAKGLDIKRQKETSKKYRKTDKYKESNRKYNKSNKGKESKRKYNNQLCSYNGEIITLHALYSRFQRAGIEHPTQEAKKYLLNNNPIEFYDVYP